MAPDLGNTPVFELSSERVTDDALVVRVKGEMDISHEEDLRAALQHAVSEDQGGIVVDLTECEFIDSSGVRALLLGREAQPTLAIASANAQVLRILSVMGIDEAIPVRPTVEEAIAELAG